MFFSFYYTDKIASYVQNNTPLKKEIIAFKNSNIVNSVNAKVDGNSIIPGINGLEVNVEKSYNQMKKNNIFNVSYIVYKEVKPNVSASDYPEKIITSGNKRKNAITIIISNNNKNMDYFKNNHIPYSLITNYNYCIILDSFKCNNTNQKVQPNYILNNSNFANYINYVSSGSIIYIDDYLDKIYIEVLIKHANFYNLKFLSLEEHLSEKNNI